MENSFLLLVKSFRTLIINPRFINFSIRAYLISNYGNFVNCRNFLMLTAYSILKLNIYKTMITMIKYAHKMYAINSFVQSYSVYRNRSK